MIKHSFVFHVLDDIPKAVIECVGCVFLAFCFGAL